MQQAINAKSILRLNALQAKTGLGRSSIYARMKYNPKRPAEFDPTFPKPVPLGAAAVGWVEDEVDRWIDSRIALRDDAQADAVGPGPNARVVEYPQSAARMLSSGGDAISYSGKPGRIDPHALSRMATVGEA